AGRFRPARAPLRPHGRPGAARPGREPCMTRLRTLTALIMAPLAVAGVLLLPTQWLAAVAAVLLLVALWEWYRLAGVEDTLAQGVLMVLNLALIVALVWASRTSTGVNWVLLQLMVVAGVLWWLVALLWLGRFTFDSRVAKLAAGTLAMVPAWAAMAVIHGDVANGHRWLLRSEERRVGKERDKRMST